MGDPVAISEADWQRAIDLNLTTAFLGCKHVLPLMLNTGACLRVDGGKSCWGR